MISIQPRKILGLSAVILCGSLLAGGGCSNENATPGKGTGGKTGSMGSGGATSSGGATGTGGANTTGGTSPATGGDTGVGTGGNASATGGAAVGGDTGTGGAAMGGDTGTGGAAMGGDTGTGGAGGMPILLSCSVAQAQAAGLVVALDPIISDFTYTDGTTAVKPNNFSFGDFYNTASGYSFHYPDRVVTSAGGAGGGGTGGAGGAAALGAPGLSEDLTGSDWHITGVMTTYSAFAINLACITDASAFAGIEFTIKGNAGTPNRLTFQASFSSDDLGSRITPSLGMCEAATCSAPSVLVNVSATKTLVQIPWSKIVGGKPISMLNPAQLTGLRWIFNWSPSSAPYAVDVTVDDLHFMTADQLADGGTPDTSAGN